MIFNENGSEVKKRETAHWQLKTSFFNSRAFQKLIFYAEKEGVNKINLTLFLLMLIDGINAEDGYFIEKKDYEFVEQKICSFLNIEVDPLFLKILLQIGWFDNGIWEKSGILTSKKFQKYYIQVKHRNRIEIPDEICLIKKEILTEQQKLLARFDKKKEGE